ncbi:hypothetical protein IW140_000634 [Coemansia sp. RSA 1813]|nr:hypothetical protein EV178_003338 [Coemansia sp. RSA 1646]KAJ1774102.1 hypothetical protein LPJ74_000201 [Coemansia sp. RSA 1843]KAJ2092506.1 hypothetical protein IW138_000944 [Coemansia sp. RSA 986]KAJ2216799.1 hypothetical protein EV179_001089 [Coemansia sp. RSA 487]KAJ2572871.1 hypothetical protein IW140_000634 [Coemansia sp. RSA 1813]
MSAAHRIKISNISRHVDQSVLEKLFSFIGDVTKTELHQSSINPEVQEAQIEFSDLASVRPALFLTGTSLADRALVVTEDVVGVSSQIGSNHLGGGAHAMPLANPPVVAMLAQRPRTLNAIPANVAAIIHPSVLQFDPLKAEEISRTIYVGNIASWVGEQQLMDFFGASGPVAYVKMAGDGMQPTRFAFVEFADVHTAQSALQMNGMMLADRPLKVNHSKNAINKPQRPSAGGAGGLPPVPGILASSAPQVPQVPTLAAIASLPSNVDPVAASLLAANSTIQARLQAVRQQQGAGLAWPVLGNTNPVTPTGTSHSDEQYITKKIRDLQSQMEDKYAKRSDIKRDRSRSSDESHRNRSHRSSRYEHRSSRRRRSPSATERRRRRDESPPQGYRSSRRGSNRSPSERSPARRSHRRSDDYYWRDRDTADSGSRRAASPWRERR